MSSGLYPGRGLNLYKASSASAREPVFPTTATIPSASSSIGIPLNAGSTTSLNVLYGTAPSGTAFSVMYDINSDFSTEYALDTVAAVASQKVYTWSTQNDVELDGFIRITNSGGQDITGAWGQQRARATG